MRTTAIIILLALPALAIPPERQEMALTWTGICVKVEDGDTIIVESDDYRVRVELYGVDAPHKRSQDGVKAWNRLKSLALDKQVTVMEVKRNKYGTWAAEVTAGKTNVNEVIIREGYALWNQQEARTDAKLKQANKQARAAGNNLWGKKPDSARPDSKAHTNQYGDTRYSNPPDYAAKVYVNTTGKYYHRAACRALKDSFTDITLQTAKGRGLKACETCGAQE